MDPIQKKEAIGRDIAEAEVKIRPLRNGFLVKSRAGWFSFPGLEEAFCHIREIMPGLILWMKDRGER